jgi:Asparagine synthase (glutamine-hydrolyzing)
VGYSDNPEASEFPFARMVAQKYGTQHHEFKLSMQGFADSLPRLVWHMDEPVADPAAIPLFFISQLARSKITVVHSGEGADEILAGYEIYKKMQTLDTMRKWGVAGLLRLLPASLWPYRVRRYVDLLALPPEERYQGVRQVFPAHLLKQAAGPSLFAADGGGYRNRVFRETYGRAADADSLNRMLYVDLKTWLPDDLLVKADKMTMAASLELRVPFLDHRVVEFAAQLPLDQKIRDGQSKHLLKQRMRGRLPDEILFAPKRGFPIPIAAWLRGSLRERAREWLLDSAFLGGWLHRPEVEKLLRRHTGTGEDMSPALYGLMCLAVWHDVFSRKVSFAQHPVAARG